MIDPCNPCVCFGAPCEQCMFGYTDAKCKHKMMVNLIQKVDAGEQLSGYKLVERYKCYHKDWKEQMGLEEKGVSDMNNKKEAGIYLETDCEECIHNEVCKNKNNAKHEYNKLRDLQYGKGPNDDYPYDIMMQANRVLITIKCPDFCKIEPVKRNGGF